MRGRRHLVIPVLALLFQFVPILFIRVVARMVYAEPRCLPESWAWTLSLLGLALCAGGSMLLGSLGVYALLTRSRLSTAVVLIVLFCIPALIGGAVYLHALLVFLTLV
jgi:hypothetical protein